MAQLPPDRPRAPYETVFAEGVQYLKGHPVLVAGLLFMLLTLVAEVPVAAAPVPEELNYLPYVLLATGLFLILLDILVGRLRQPAASSSTEPPPSPKPLSPQASSPSPSEATPAPPREPPSPQALRARYLREQLDRCTHVPMTTIDIKAATRKEAAQLDLAAVFTDLDIHDVGREEEGGPKRGGHDPQMEQPDRRLPVLAALSRYDRLVLLGDPGSGKSTLVNFVTLCLAGVWLGRPGA